MNLLTAAGGINNAQHVDDARSVAEQAERMRFVSRQSLRDSALRAAAAWSASLSSAGDVEPNLSADERAERQGLLARYARHCSGERTQIMHQDLVELTLGELRTLVHFSNACYTLDAIHQVIRRVETAGHSAGEFVNRMVWPHNRPPITPEQRATIRACHESAGQNCAGRIFARNIV